MMMLQFLRMTGYHWFWRQWRTLVTLVLVSVFLFLPMLSLETANTMMKVWCAGVMDVLPSVFSCSFSIFLWAAASTNTCSWWLRGCELVMAVGAENDSMVVAGARWLGCWEAPVKRLLCWRRRSCTVGLTGVNAAGAEGGGDVIAFQSSLCLWKKRLHRWRRRNWRQKQRDEGDGEGMLVGLSVFSSVYVVSFCSSLSCFVLSGFSLFFLFLRIYIYVVYRYRMKSHFLSLFHRCSSSDSTAHL